MRPQAPDPCRGVREALEMVAETCLAVAGGYSTKGANNWVEMDTSATVTGFLRVEMNTSSN